VTEPCHREAKPVSPAAPSSTPDQRLAAHIIIANDREGWNLPRAALDVFLKLGRGRVNVRR
jgi:hypothetical protein